MHRPFAATAAACVILLAILAAQQIGRFAVAKEAAALAGGQSQSIQNLFDSEFAIVRIEGHHASVAGMAFVIHQGPMRLLTCYHVVSQGTESNDGPVVYAIARRSGSVNEIDVRRVTWSWLRIKRMVFKPEYDLALLEIDPQVDAAIASRLDLKDSKPLTLNFDSSQRSIGTAVTWLTTAARGDLTLTPRLFTGSVIANYITDERYSYSTGAGNPVSQVITGARMLEVDKLFIPGSSGSPILNANSRQVIGYVHGYRAFALSSNAEVTEDVKLGLDSVYTKEKLKYKPPLVTSVSLGIDLRTAETFLAQEDHVAK